MLVRNKPPELMLLTSSLNENTGQISSQEMVRRRGALTEAINQIGSKEEPLYLLWPLEE